MKTFLIPFSSSSHSATIEVIFNIIKKDFHTVKTQWREKVRIDGKQFHYNRTCWIFFSFISHNMKKQQQLQVFHPSIHFFFFDFLDFFIARKTKEFPFRLSSLHVFDGRWKRCRNQHNVHFYIKKIFNDSSLLLCIDISDTYEEEEECYYILWHYHTDDKVELKIPFYSTQLASVTELNIKKVIAMTISLEKNTTARCEVGHKSENLCDSIEREFFLYFEPLMCRACCSTAWNKIWSILRGVVWGICEYARESFNKSHIKVWQPHDNLQSIPITTYNSKDCVWWALT